MKKFITFILYPLLLTPILHADETFSVEIDALKLVMEQYKENNESNIQFDENIKKPNYLALKQRDLKMKWNYYIREDKKNIIC